MQVIQNPGTVIKARSAPGENGRHSVRFKIICFIKLMWETWKYTVGAAAAASYFLPRIPDLSLLAIPLHLSPDGLLCLLVHFWKLSCLDNEYPLSFLMVGYIALWHAVIEDQSGWRLRRILALCWYPGFIQMRRCEVGLGVKLSSPTILNVLGPTSPQITPGCPETYALVLFQFWQSKFIIMATPPFS